MTTVTWDANFVISPADADEYKYGANKIRQLKTAIQERLDVEHTFANDGKHIPGKTSVLYSGNTAQIAALANMSAGAVAWDTQTTAFKRYNGSSWDTLTGPTGLTLANNAECLAGTEANKAMSPAGHTSAAAANQANQAEMEAASNTVKVVSPGVARYHPGMAKAWARIGSDGSINASYGVDSVTRTGTGKYTIYWTPGFSTGYYAVFVTSYHSGGSARYFVITGQATNYITLEFWDGTPTAADPEAFYVVAFGDV